MSVLPYVFASVVGAAIVVWIWVLAGASSLKKPRQAEAGDREKYGHPIRPIAELKKGLPAAPPGFLWEITVERQESSGHRLLKLKLLSMSPSEVVAECSKNLDWFGLFHESWASYYKSHPSWLTEDDALKQIVRPLIDWATAEAGKRMGGSGLDYHEVIA